MPSRIDTLIAKCASWDDFVLLANNQQDNKFKGDLFERLTQVFLQTSSTYVSKLKNVWWCNNNELPENIRKKLRLPIADEGIDLICETVEGEFWSVQCKYKANQNQPLTHKELSTFTSLSFNTATDIVLGLVVHTSTKKVRKSNLMTNVTELGLEKWLEISKEDWKRIRTVCRSNKLLPPKKRKPRKHQKTAIKDAVHHYSALSKSRGKLIMPCGTGKSLTAFWIAQALKSKSIIVAVPSLTLVRDSLADWTAEFLSHGIKPNWIAVCSDNTVGATADADSAVATVYETGIPTTTDKQKIQKFLERKSKLPKIVFTTYQSGQKLCDATNESSIKFDLLICDEAHKTVGSSNKAFAALLFDENISAKHRIFMTATERIYRQSKDDVVSMDDPNVYGEVFHELSFKEAIKQKIICDYKILTIAVTANEAKALIENNEGLRVADGKDSFETDAHNLSVGFTLQKVFGKYKIKHAVSFHSSIKRAKFFSDQQGKLSTKREIKNYHVSSKHSAGERARILRNFANDNLSLISNARCLTEGVDIPSIDCVVFVDPKHSTVDIVQAAGRAMRQSKGTGKEFGYILLPLIVPGDEDLSDFATKTSFSDVSRVITSLSTSDKRIAEQLRQSVINKLTAPTDIVQIDTEFLGALSVDPDEFKRTISTRIWENVGKANWRPFDEAKQFVQSLKFTKSEKWLEFRLSGDKPSDLPAHPDRVYANKGWIDWPDFLGYKNPRSYSSGNKDFYAFKKARSLTRKKGFKSQKEFWQSFDTNYGDKRIPKYPHTVYGEEFISYPDFIGHYSVKNTHKNFRPFIAARNYVRALNFKSTTEYNKWAATDERPTDIPTLPSVIYRNEGFKSFPDFIGKRQDRKKYWGFKKARKYARNHPDLTTARSYNQLIQKQEMAAEMPVAPYHVYRNKGWAGWEDFTGNDNHTRVKSEFFSYVELKKLIFNKNLNTANEFWNFIGSIEISKKVPKRPASFYEDWPGWLEFLSNDTNDRNDS